MECPICYNDKKDIYACDICNHVICMDCKNDWKRDCPFCRQLYSPTSEIQSPMYSPRQYVDVVDIVHEPFNTSCVLTTGGCLFICGILGYIGFIYS